MILFANFGPISVKNVLNLLAFSMFEFSSSLTFKSLYFEVLFAVFLIILFIVFHVFFILFSHQLNEDTRKVNSLGFPNTFLQNTIISPKICFDI